MKKIWILVSVFVLGCFHSLYAANNALEFDGINDYVLVPDSDSLDLTNGMTIEAWIKPASFHGDNVVLSKWNSPPNSYIFKVFDVGSNRIRIEATTQNSTVDLRGETALSTGNWIHIAATYESGGARVFLNGIEDGSQMGWGEINVTDKDVLIGATPYYGQWFNGAIDELRVWNYARTPEQLNQWKGFLLTGDEPGLVAYWNFDEGNGDILNDLTSSRNNGQIYGAQWVTSGSPVKVVPEPISGVLFSAGGLLLAAVRKRVSKKS